MSAQIHPHIQEILRHLPQTPGVYQMRDEGGRVIYVGKSINLRSRVSSYFQDRGSLTAAKRQMVDRIRDIEILLCQNEVEALILETNLIKHLTPKYNILMKDDKNLAYIKISHEPVAQVYRTRQRIQDGAMYYGPYTQGANIFASIRALKKIFHIRDCRLVFTDHGGRMDVVGSRASLPCMDYYIGICPGPCRLTPESLASHQENIERLKRFLKGGVERTEVLADLTDRMRAHASRMEFEEAQKIKEMITSLDTIMERQIARDSIPGDHDVFVMLEKYEKYYVGIMQIRGGQIIGMFRHLLTLGIDTPDEIVGQFLARHYLDEDTTVGYPTSLIVTDPITDEYIQKMLSSKSITIHTPQIGPKKELIEFAMRQLREYAHRAELTTLENSTLTREHMRRVLQSLGYEAPAKGEIVFECYDISHTAGHFTYASRVCIVDGRPDTSRYKKYKIKILEDGDIDDYASHREVMVRRTLEGLRESNFPHLIIIDGGKGQLSSAISGAREGMWQYESDGKVKSEKGVLKSEELIVKSEKGKIGGTEEGYESQKSNPPDFSQIQQDLFQKHGTTTPPPIVGTPQEGNSKPPTLQHSNIPIFEHSNTRDLPFQICSLAKRIEEVFVPGESTSIILEKGTPELMVIQKARDESHRFSITANRSARMKSMKKNILEELPGIGPVTRKKLLSLAGSIDGMKKLTPEELTSICTKTQIETLRDHGMI